jgi:hypothetical protein
MSPGVVPTGSEWSGARQPALKMNSRVMPAQM